MKHRNNLRSAARALAAFSRARRKPAAARDSRRPLSYRPRLEAFEDRTVPSVFTVMNTLDSGAGSLRDMIAAAANNDTIVFDPSLNGQMITLTSGELAITKNLDIEGPGASQLTISGNDASRVFDITGGNVNVTIAGLTITHGRADGSAPIIPSEGGGILNYGSLTLANDVLLANQALGDPSASPGGILGGAAGGGIASLGRLTLSGTTFTSNLAQGANGASVSGIAAGGALISSAPATVTDSAFDHNQAIGGSQNSLGEGLGGAIINFGSTLTVTGSSFSYNQAIGGKHNQGGTIVGRGSGGGIHNGRSSSATLTVGASTFDPKGPRAWATAVPSPWTMGRPRSAPPRWTTMTPSAGKESQAVLAASAPVVVSSALPAWVGRRVST